MIIGDFQVRKSYKIEWNISDEQKEVIQFP